MLLPFGLSQIALEKVPIESLADLLEYVAWYNFYCSNGTHFYCPESRGPKKLGWAVLKEGLVEQQQQLQPASDEKHTSGNSH